MFAVVSAKAQFTQGFEGPETNLTSNCWSLTDLTRTTDPGEIITGTASMLSTPISMGAISEVITPALNFTSTSLTVSFNYKLTNKLNNTSTRTISIGVIDVDGSFTTLYTITLDNNTPLGVQNFSQMFTLPSTGHGRVSLRLGGPAGDGNSRVIFDDLYISANALYGSGTCNSAPVAVNDVFNGTIGLPYSGAVMPNDSDPDGEFPIAVLVTNSANGTVVLNEDGTFTFTPNPGFVGTSTTFTYQLNDKGFTPLLSNIATVTINLSVAATLPVELKYFTAQLNNSRVDLKWATLTEINASHFVIERSYNGSEFGDVATVMAFGNTTEEKTYQFADQNFANDKQVIYYRLRQVDVDGKIDYSSTRIIRFGKGQAVATILTFPNPVMSEVRITIPTNWQGKKVNYEIVNANGQMVRKLETASSSQTETIDVSNLGRGFYVVRVNCLGETAVQKIVKH